jgi:hypothetical protein
MAQARAGEAGKNWGPRACLKADTVASNHHAQLVFVLVLGDLSLDIVQ